MALIGAMNKNDPRFQEALLQAGAGGPKNLLGASKRITAAHTGREMDQRLAFARLAQDQRQFNDRLGLSRDRLQWSSSLFKQMLRRKKHELNLTTLGGLATTGFGYLEGKRRKELLAKDNAERKEWQNEFRSMRRKEHDAFMKKMYPPSSWEWTSEEQ